jgi:hypothetical protein
MSKAKQLSKEELEKYQASRQEVYMLRNRLCDITIQEENNKTNKQMTLMNLNEATSTAADLDKELREKYGDDIKIDFATGNLE